MQSYTVIPARLQSTRLPRKMLLRETGKTLIQHTYEAASRASKTCGTCVATDHQEIEEEVRRFGGNVRLTNPQAVSGTDRIVEVSRDMPEIDVFVNVQGDEPEIQPKAIDQVIALLEDNEHVPMATLAVPIRNREILVDPNCVKVVCNAKGRALYFSRSQIPYAREWSDDLLHRDPPLFLLHLGIYAYRRDFLLKLAEWPASTLEDTEKLEQLRVLQAGYPIAVGVTEHAAPGIDTMQDYRAFAERCRGRAATRS